MSQILVFGDSIAYGLWDSEGGWVQRLRQLVDQKIRDSKFELDCSVFNLGISGNTSEDILARLEDEIQPRKEGGMVIMIAIGTNDSVVNLETGNFWVSPAKYQENLEKIVKKATKYSDRVVLLGLFPVDERVDPIPWVENCSYKNENIKMYEQILESVARLNNTDFIPLFDKFSKDPKRLLEDGVHPNSKGHAAIYQVVLEYLQKNNIIDL